MKTRVKNKTIRINKKITPWVIIDHGQSCIYSQVGQGPQGNVDRNVSLNIEVKLSLIFITFHQRR